MYMTATIESGFTPAGFYAHGDYMERLCKSTPIVCENLIIKHHKCYMDCAYNLHFSDKIIGFYAPLYAYSPYDIYYWLEFICGDFSKAYFLLDEEGPEIMMRCEERSNYGPYVRLSILAPEEKYFDEQSQKFQYNKEIEKIFHSTKETQVIADYLVKKEDLITGFLRETDNFLKSLTKNDWDIEGPIRKPAIPHVRKFLKEIKKR